MVLSESGKKSMAETPTTKKMKPSPDTRQLTMTLTDMAPEVATPQTGPHQNLAKKKPNPSLNTGKKPTLDGGNALAGFKRDMCRPLDMCHPPEPRRQCNVERRSRCILHGRRNGSSRRKRVPASCRVKERRSNFPRRCSLFNICECASLGNALFRRSISKSLYPSGLY